jgi:hypothetical protein
MIQLQVGGYLWWDVDLQTFRGHVIDTDYGTYIGEIMNPRAIPGVTESEALAVEGERAAWLKATSATPANILTKEAFLDRFTLTEQITILTAAKSSVAIEAWLFRFNNATTVDLLYQPTIDGVNAMEAGGILAAGRAAQILAP